MHLHCFLNVQTPKAIVFIDERSEVADVTFPSKPVVVSLRDYDDIEGAKPNPVQGYPLICVTVSGNVAVREGEEDMMVAVVVMRVVFYVGISSKVLNPPYC